MKAIFLISGFICFQLTVHAQAKITFRDSAFYPEGVAYNAAKNEFYVGSVKTGTLNRIDASGKKTVLLKDASLKSSFGMKTDSNNKILWVCTGDPNYSIHKTPATDKKLARLIAVEIATGNKIKDIDLSTLYPGNHFINDLCFDDAGNIYVTDSYAPVIYKVDKNGSPALLVENGLLQANDIGLNGIAWHKKGFLLTVNNSNGTILKVNLLTKEVSKVKIDNFFPGADGLILLNETDLILVQNQGVEKVFKITSNDGWTSAKIMSATETEDRFSQPSTATLKGKDVYVLNSKLNEINDESKKPSEEFSIQQAVLKPVK